MPMGGKAPWVNGMFCTEFSPPLATIVCLSVAPCHQNCRSPGEDAISPSTRIRTCGGVGDRSWPYMGIPELEK